MGNLKDIRIGVRDPVRSVRDDLAAKRLIVTNCIMLLFVGLFSIVCLSGLSNGMHSTQAESTIKFAFGLFRHGIRAPYPFYYPNNPYQDDKKYFPEGLKELTKIGKEKIYEVGKIFRARYDEVLGDLYSSENVYFQTTAVERTMMSVEIMAKSIYPPKGVQKWGNNKSWQPIPVWVDYGDVDKVTLFLRPNICPRFNQLQNEAIARLSNSDIQYLYKPLSQLCGKELNNTLDLLFLWDNLFFQDLNGLRVPKWAKNIYPVTLRNVNNQILKSWIADTPEQLKFSSGTLFHFIKTVLSSKANNTLTPNRKVFLVGGHDTTLVCLLNGIGNVEPLQSAPGATLVFELHEIDGQHIVKAFYLDIINSDNRFHEITIPRCGNPCTLDSFLSSIESIDNEEFNRICSETNQVT